jgi:predicted DNA binding CopG/RHH family protein
MSKIKLNTKDKYLHIRLKNDELDKLKTKALAQEISLSEYVRKMLF